MKIAYVRTGGGGGGGSRPMRMHCVQGGGWGQKMANFCVRTLWMAPKYCVILKKSEIISRFCIVKTQTICLFQQRVYEDHEIQNLLPKFTFRNISLEKNPKM